jgi:hypothetical protein
VEEKAFEIESSGWPEMESLHMKNSLIEKGRRVNRDVACRRVRLISPSCALSGSRSVSQSRSSARRKYDWASSRFHGRPCSDGKGDSVSQISRPFQNRRDKTSHKMSSERIMGTRFFQQFANDVCDWLDLNENRSDRLRDSD